MGMGRRRPVGRSNGGRTDRSRSSGRICDNVHERLTVALRYRSFYSTDHSYRNSKVYNAFTRKEKRRKDSLLELKTA